MTSSPRPPLDGFALLLLLTTCSFPLVVSGCSGGSGGSSGQTASGSTPATPASSPAPQPQASWSGAPLSSTPGGFAAALAGTASAGSRTLAVAIADEVLVDDQREAVGAQVEALVVGPDGLAASTAAGIYQRTDRGWERVVTGPSGPAALARVQDQLYAFADARLDVADQGAWTTQAGVLPANFLPTAAAEHMGAVWVGGQTTEGPAFLSRGTQADGFVTVATPFLCGADELQRVTDLLSSDGELFIALGTFAAGSLAPLRGEIYRLDASGAPEQLLMFQQDVPTALARLNGVVYAGTSVGRIIQNELGSVWLPERGVPSNLGIHDLLALDGELIAAAQGPDGALLLTRSLRASTGTGAGGSGGSGGMSLPVDVAAALNDCGLCHAVWVNDLDQVLARVDLNAPASSTLLLKASNTSSTPHGGGAIWATSGNAHYDTVLAWIQAGAPAGAGSGGGGSGTTGGGGTTFVHKWPLTGAHAQATCGDCHANNVFVGTSTDCSSCHLTDYQQTTSPAHATAGYPLSCDRCHTTTSFAGASFTHPWAFEGAHVMVANDCATCHANQSFAGTSKDCFACHRDDYLKTVQPNHTAAGFPTTCDGCHSQATFKGANFTHKWPFTGAHVNVKDTCNACHADQVYAGRSTACYACHSQSFLTAPEPNHTAARFPTTCETCHTTTTFAQAPGFTHKWPFSGAHVNLANNCNACHGDGVYVGRSTACASCHSQRFLTATNPNHTAAAFPMTCDSCHTTASFAQAPGFRHTWPFTGKHLTVANNCNACHADGVYAGRSNACYSCHAQDYAQAVPNHTTSGFGTECQACHTTNQFAGATFNHRFPQRHGNANSCSTCHPDANNFANFSCTGCHGKTQTDNKHQGRRGYSYVSSACYGCHPTGRS